MKKLFVFSVLALAKTKLLAWNEAARELIGIACNELSIDGEWLKITPWGEFDNKVGLQKITKDDGQSMVSAFNSFRGRLGRTFMGLPIYVGHPDLTPKDSTDRRRYGRINDLQVREDGLYGLVAMNNLGKEMLAEGHYQFASPAWVLRRDGKHVRPTQLLSVGLTNTPQIPGDPWAKNETERNDMPKWLIDLLATAGLMQPEGTEENAKTAVNELLASRQRVTDLESSNALLKTQLSTATNERDTYKAEVNSRDKGLERLNGELKTEHKNRIDRELEFAVNSGRIPQAERAAWNDKLTSDFDGALKALNEAKPKVPTENRIGSLGGRKGEGAASGQKITAINDAVRKYATEHGLNIATNGGYNAAYSGVKQSQPALFQ